MKIKLVTLLIFISILFVSCNLGELSGNDLIGNWTYDYTENNGWAGIPEFLKIFSDSSGVWSNAGNNSGKIVNKNYGDGDISFCWKVKQGEFYKILILYNIKNDLSDNLNDISLNYYFDSNKNNLFLQRLNEFEWVKLSRD